MAIEKKNSSISSLYIQIFFCYWVLVRPIKIQRRFLILCGQTYLQIITKVNAYTRSKFGNSHSTLWNYSRNQVIFSRNSNDVSYHLLEKYRLEI